MSRVTHSTHALLSFVSAPVSFATSLGSHFSLLFFSVIYSLFPLLSLPLTSQIAHGMYLLLLLSAAGAGPGNVVVFCPHVFLR